MELEIFQTQKHFVCTLIVPLLLVTSFDDFLQMFTTLCVPYSNIIVVGYFNSKLLYETIRCKKEVECLSLTHVVNKPPLQTGSTDAFIDHIFTYENEIQNVLATRVKQCDHCPIFLAKRLLREEERKKMEFQPHSFINNDLEAMNMRDKT